MKKRNTKKIIAILLTILLLPWSNFLGLVKSDVHAASEESFEWWSIRDAGFEDGDYLVPENEVYKIYQGNTTTKTLDKSAFTTLIEFNATKSGAFNFWIGNGDMSGFAFQTEGGALRLLYANGASDVRVVSWFDPQTAGCTLLGNKDLKLTMTTEFVNTNGSNTDVKVGVYFNDKLYNDQYFTVSNVPISTLKRTITICNYGNTLWVKSPIAVPVEWEQWGIRDAGIEDGSVAVGLVGGKATEKTLPGSAFTTLIEMSEILGNFNFWIGTGEFSGFSFQTDSNWGCFRLLYANGTSDVRVVSTFDPTVAGYKLLENKHLILTMTTELVSQSNNIATLKVGVYFNGKLYNNQYFTVENVPLSTIKRTATMRNGGTDLWLKSPLPVVETEEVTSPDDLTPWDIKTVGLEDGDYVKNGTATGKSQNGTAFRSKITFPAGMTGAEYINLWIGNEGTGYVIQASANGGTSLAFMHFGSNFSRTIEADKAGVDTFAGKEFELTLTTEFVNTSGDKTDVNVGLYINNKLYDNQYLKITGASVNDFPQNIIGRVDAGGKNMKLVAPASQEPAGPIAPPTDLEVWTIETAGLEDGDYGWQNNVSSLTGNMVGTAFTTMVGFDNQDKVNLWIGNGNSDQPQHNGFLLHGKNGILEFQHWTNGASDFSTVLTSAVAGAQLVDNKNLKLTLTVRRLNTTEVEVGVFFNDVLYDGKYFEITATDASLPKNIAVNGWGAGMYLGTPEALKKPVEIITPPQNLNYWTIEHAGLENGDYTWQNNIASMEGSVVGSAFSTMVAFDNQGLVNLWIGNGGSDSPMHNGFLIQGTPTGLAFQHWSNNNNGDFATTMTSKTAGVELLGNKELKFTLTVEEIDDTKVKVGVFFNDVLYNGKYFEIEATEDSLPKNIAVNGWGASIYLAVPKGMELPPEPVTSPDDLEKWTIRDVGLSDGEYHSYHVGTALEGNQDQSVFSTAVKFPKGMEGSECVNLWIGDELNGYIIQAAAGEDLTFMHFSDSVPDYTLRLSAEKTGSTLVGEILDFSITTEFVNTQGNTTDVNVGIYLNGVLYGNKYVKLKGVPVDKFAKQIVVDARSCGGRSVQLWADSQSDLLELTAEDFTLDGANITNKTRIGIYGQDIFSATAVNLTMQFPSDKETELYFGGKNQGIRLQAQGKGSIQLAYVDENRGVKEIAILNPKEVGVSSLTDTSLRWRFVFKLYKSGEDTAKLLLGVYANGQLYNAEYFEVKSVALSNMTRMIAVHAGNGTVKISNPAYNELTFHDFSILDTEIQSATATAPYAKYNFYDKAILDATAVSGVVRFSAKEGDRFVLGGDVWQGFNFVSGKDGRIQVIYVPTEGPAKMIAYLEAEKAGVESLTDADLKLKVTFDLFKTSAEKTDAKLNIYINGKLYNGKSFMVQDVELKQMTRTCYIYVCEGPFKVESIKKPCDFSIYGFDRNWRKTLGL